MINIAKFNISVSATDSGVGRTFSKVKKQSVDLKNSVDGFNFRGIAEGFDTLSFASSGLTASFRSLLLAAGPIGVALAAIGAAIGAVTLSVGNAARFEQTETSFRTLIGDAQETKGVLQELTDFAASTPFQLPDIQNAGRSLIAFGSDTKTLSDELRRLGDISAGTGKPLGELSEIYGKARVQGRLFGEDINQFTGAGIPIIEELAKQFGVAESEIKELTSQGVIGFDALQNAIISMTDEGGKFAGQTEAQSKTLIGLWSTTKDLVGQLATEFGKTFLPVLKTVLNVANSLLKTLVDGFKAVRRGLFGIKEASEDADKFKQKLEKNPIKFVDADQTKMLEDMKKRAESITKSFRTAPQVFEDTVAELRSLLEEELITKDTFDRAFADAKKKLTESGIDKEFEKLKRRGEALFESVKTPAEIFKDTLRDAKELFSAEVISQDTLDRVTEKAKSDFRNSLDSVKEIEDRFNRLGKVNVLERLRRGTAEEFTARIESTNQAKRLEVVNSTLIEQNRLIEQLIGEVAEDDVIVEIAERN